MSDKQMYAVPISPYAVNDEDLARLRRALEVAELQVRRATTWPAKTRAEQDVLSLQRQISGAEVQARLDQAHQKLNTPRADAQAVQLRRAVAAGRCLAPVPYFAPPLPPPAQNAAEDDLPTLKVLAHKLQAVIDNPAATADAKLSAQAELDRVTQLIRSLEAMHPTGTVGVGHAATFDEVATVVEAARKAGVVQSYNIVKPKA